jgi:hypothetical protein
MELETVQQFSCIVSMTDGMIQELNKWGDMNYLIVNPRRTQLVYRNEN